jgi:hypothetical protein
MIISETSLRIDRPQRSSLRTRFLTSERNRENRLENGGIPRWEDQVTIHPLAEEWVQEDMIRDAQSERRIHEDGYQANSGKHRHDRPSLPAIVPTTQRGTQLRSTENLRLKSTKTTHHRISPLPILRFPPSFYRSEVYKAPLPQNDIFNDQFPVADC